MITGTVSPRARTERGRPSGHSAHRREDSSFEPAENQVSPKVRETFRDVRRRALPSIVKQEYADAKTTFEKGDVASARVRFERVVLHLDALEALGSKDLGDLRVLSSGSRSDCESAKVSAAQAAAAAAAKAAEKPLPPPPPAIYSATRWRCDTACHDLAADADVAAGTPGRTDVSSRVDDGDRRDRCGHRGQHLRQSATELRRILAQGCDDVAFPAGDATGRAGQYRKNVAVRLTAEP